ncbi:MAG: hypothetical protein ISR57_03185 [Bacteroidales bacterium]|nr:hypothetical protein [Bacteroidales bacterium]
MIDWIKKTSAFILILPVLLLVLHDVIPHHHHANGIHGVVCSHHEASDCEDGDHHTDIQLSESHHSCDIENCEACHFPDEFVIDDTYRKSLSILPPHTLFSFNVDNPIQITPFLQTIHHERGYLLTFNKRGPPTNFA